MKNNLFCMRLTKLNWKKKESSIMVSYVSYTSRIDKPCFSDSWLNLPLFVCYNIPVLFRHNHLEKDWTINMTKLNILLEPKKLLCVLSVNEEKNFQQ